MRRVLASGVVLGLAALVACGGSDVPKGIPAIEKPDAGHVDAGPDAGPVDAGEWFPIACGDAGCSDLDHCQPLDGGEVACGPLCGEACSDARCAEGSCNDLDGGTGWGPAVCTNAPTPKHWSKDPACNDGNPCTTGDTCLNGACASVAAPTSTSCDDGNVCTTGDHCDGSGGCTGNAVHDARDRFFNSSAATYAYAAPGGWSYSGWADDGVIYSSVPGGQDIHLLFDSTAVDRILSFSTSVGSYSGSTVVGAGLSSHANGTVELYVSSYTCGAVSGSCSTVGGSGAARHYFYTAGHGVPPAGSGSGSGIWVCPP